MSKAAESSVNVLPIAVPLALLFPAATVSDHSVLMIPVLALVLATGIAAWRGWFRVRVDVILLLPFAVALAWGALSILWSSVPEISVARAMRAAGLAVGGCALLGLAIRLRRRGGTAGALRPVAWAYLVGLSLSLAAMAADIATGGALFLRLNLIDDPTWPLEMQLSQLNPAATVIAVYALPGTLLLWRGIGPAVAILMLAAVAAVLAVSEAMAARVAFVAALFIAGGVLVAGRVALATLGAALVTLVIVVPMALGMLERPFVALHDTLARAGWEMAPSALHRAYIYDFTLQRMADRPLLGWGMGASRELPGGQQHIAGLDRERLPLHPHSGVLEVWVELGPVGAFCLAWIVVAAIAGAGRRMADPPAAAVLTGAVGAYFVVGLFAYSIWSGWWIAAGIMLAALAAALFRTRAPAVPPGLTPQL